MYSLLTPLIDRSPRLSQLIAALESADAFDHPVVRFEVIETHISSVLLTGPFAYKFKKPITLDFLDFGTPEKRLACLRDELRLNRRTAPQLYVDIVSIHQTSRGPRINGAGPILEHALRMVEFPTRDRGDHALCSGEIDAEHLRRLGQAIARFHAAIPSAPPDTDLGSPRAVLEDVVTTLDAIATHPGLSEEDSIALREVRNWVKQAWHEHRETIAERVRAGFVREGHGDLHLANLVMLDGALVAFDCIEFSERLRFIDVMSEIAFLMMDLDYHQRPDLAVAFLNSYLETSGDYAGLELLPFYLAYRAAVRAKVSALRMSQVTDGERARERSHVSAHLTLARRFAQAPPAPSLIITTGLSGAGKSWLAQRMAPRIGAVTIRSDVERKRLGLTDPYSKPAIRQTYQRLARIAESLLRHGYSLIVDATFLSGNRRHAFAALAKRCSASFIILEAHAPAALLRERVGERLAMGTDPSDADAEVLAGQLRSVRPLSAREQALAITVDTREEPDWEALRHAVERLGYPRVRTWL